MGIIDNYLAAQIGLTAVSGIAIANNILTIYQALFIALGAAVSSLIARSIGEQNHSKEINYMANAILVTGALSVVLGLVSIVGYKSILAFLGAASLVARLGGQYLAIVGGMILSLGLLTSLGAIIRAKGQPSIPMKVSLLTNLLNAVFSALSLYIWGFGVIGIAWSTVVSRLIGVVILCQFLPIKRIIKHFVNPLDKEIFSLSLPAAGERLMMRAGDVLIVAIIVRFGTEILAGNAIGETLTQFNYMPGLAMSTATVILVANQLGSGKGATIAKTVKETFLLATLMMLVVGLITYLLGPGLLPLFTADAKAQQASMVVLVCSLIGVPATAGTLVYTAAWQGIGQAKLPFYATTIGMWLVRITLGYFIGVTLNYGLIGVWLATILDNATRWLILAVAFKKQQKLLSSDCHS